MLLKLSRLVGLLIVMAAFGCEQPIKWTMQPGVDPDPIKAGADFSVLCKVAGDLKQVGFVNAVPIAAPEYTMEMNDEGKEGDAKKGDGVYSHKRDLPGSVDAGEYELEFVVYDKKGEPIQVPSFTLLGKDGKTVIKEVKPSEADGKAVEFATIIEVTVE